MYRKPGNPFLTMNPIRPYGAKDNRPGGMGGDLPVMPKPIVDPVPPFAKQEGTLLKKGGKVVNTPRHKVKKFADGGGVFDRAVDRAAAQARPAQREGVYGAQGMYTPDEWNFKKNLSSTYRTLRRAADQYADDPQQARNYNLYMSTLPSRVGVMQQGLESGDYAIPNFAPYDPNTKYGGKATNPYIRGAAQPMKKGGAAKKTTLDTKTAAQRAKAAKVEKAAKPSGSKIKKFDVGGPVYQGQGMQGFSTPEDRAAARYASMSPAKKYEEQLYDLYRPIKQARKQFAIGSPEAQNYRAYMQTMPSLGYYKNQVGFGHYNEPIPALPTLPAYDPNHTYTREEMFKVPKETKPLREDKSPSAGGQGQTMERAQAIKKGGKVKKMASGGSVKSKKVAPKKKKSYSNW